MSIRFDDKVAIVTGAGGGLGRSHALDLASRGAKVVVNELGGSVDGASKGSSSAAEKVVEEIKAAGGEAIANGASVTDVDQVKEMVQQTMDAYGRIDILVNNAGILRDKSFSKVEDEDFRMVMEVHLMGSVNCTKAVWEIMKEQNYGRIVMTSSSSGLYGNFGQTNYGAAKMGMLGLMNVLALEGRPHGIKVNCLSPGADTRMTALDKELGIDPDKPRPQSHPKLVTPVALFLASEDAPTGMVIHGISGKYLRTETFANEGISLDQDALAEDLISNIEEVLDMSNAKGMAELGKISSLGS